MDEINTESGGGACAEQSGAVFDDRNRRLPELSHPGEIQAVPRSSRPRHPLSSKP
jgi:hypothetical protein